jgi:hypothetical protein
MAAVHHTGFAVKPNMMKQIYVPEGNYWKVYHEGKYLRGENVFQLT